MLELEIKRGSAEEALDAKKLADEVCMREEDRKVYHNHRGGGGRSENMNEAWLLTARS